MNTIVLLCLNLPLVGLFVYLFRKPNLLFFHQSGRWWLTWMAVAVITLMDEFTSIFYAPAEAYRFIGPSAIFFIALTSILIRFMSTRFTEIAEILEYHDLIGGGVYSFSYLVLGCTISFVAVASIMVDYILTACLSAVSAILNAVSFFPLLSQSQPLIISLVLLIIWAIAGLNILGIRKNARFTFMVFVLAAFIIFNLVASGLLALDQESLNRLGESFNLGLAPLKTGSFLRDYDNFISHVAFCILAYSGIESVIQTADFVKNWHEIRRAYLFLAFTVGVVTPLVAALALSAPIDFKQHEGDLITHYATSLNGYFFGALVAALASMTLMMAVNTAFVASSELLERVAHRYGFSWIIATNSRHSLYRIHLLNSCFFFSCYTGHSRQPKNFGRYVCNRSSCQFLYQYGLTHNLSLFYADQGGPLLPYRPIRNSGAVYYIDKLFRVSGFGQALWHHALAVGHQRGPYLGNPDRKEACAGNQRDWTG